MQLTGCHVGMDKGVLACSNWVRAPPAVQRWCRRPSRHLAAHVAQPATEPAAEQQGTHLSAVSAALLGAQQVIVQQQQQGQQWQEQQQQQGAIGIWQQEPDQRRASVGDAAAAAAANVASGADASAWGSPGFATTAAAVNGTQSSSTDSGSSSGLHAAHFSWQAAQLDAADDTDGDELLQSESTGSSSSSSSSSSIQVQVDRHGYYVYTAEDLQRDQQLPLEPSALREQQFPPPQQQQQHQQGQGQVHLQEQQQEHMQQLLQQQHQLHQQQQQLQQAVQQQHHQQPQQQQQQQLQKAKLPQRPHRNALSNAQYFREKSNRRLTSRIRDVEDLAGLRQIMRQYEGALNHIQVAALLVRLTKMLSKKQLRPRDMLALPSVLSQVLSLVEAAVPSFDERGISNCLHCMAVLELGQERQLLASLLTAAENLNLSRFKRQGLAATAWALGSLRLNPGPRLSSQLLVAASGSLGQLSGAELAQLGWGIATLRLKVDDAWLGPWRKAIVRVLPELTPQGLSMLLWSCARLTEPQQAALRAAGGLPAAATATASSNSSSSSSGGDGPQVNWLQAAEKALQQQLPEHSPHSVSICLWAFGKLGYRPRKEVTSAALRVVQPQLLRGASPSDLAVLLISLAAFGYRPSRSWLRDHGAALRRQLQHLGVRRIANLLWAHAKLGLRPMDDLLLADMVQVLHGSLHETNTRDLANSLWALATLGYMPPRGFLSAFGEQAQALVHEFPPQEISNLLWAYAKLGVKPPHMLLVALWESIGVGTTTGSSSGISSGGSDGSSGSGSIGARLSAFKPQELAMLVWALAVLKLVPGKAWWEQFLQSSYHKMGSQTPQSLASIIWSLSELQLQPPPAWLYHWAAAARAVLGSMNPVDLGQVAAALQGPTFQPLHLSKLEGLLLDVLDRLAALEVSSGAYSKAAMHMLLKMQGAVGLPDNSSSSSGGGSGAGSRLVRRVPRGSSSNGSSSSVSSSDILGVSEVAASTLSVGAGQDSRRHNGELASGGAVDIDGLKDYLVKQSAAEGSINLDDVPELHLTP